MFFLIANLSGVAVMLAYVYASWHDRIDLFDWANLTGGFVLVPANIVVALSVGAWFGPILSAGFWVGSMVSIWHRHRHTSGSGGTRQTREA